MVKDSLSEGAPYYHPPAWMPVPQSAASVHDDTPGFSRHPRARRDRCPPPHRWPADHSILARFYTNDPAVATIAADLLRLAALFQISDGLQVGALGALRGLKDVLIPLLIVLVSYWLIAFSLAWLLGIRWGWGPTGPWLGLIAGLTTAAVLLNARFWWLSARLG